MIQMGRYMKAGSKRDLQVGPRRPLFFWSLDHTPTVS
jgi:hypothetical protein